MICPKCGFSVSNTARSCPTCGAAVDVHAARPGYGRPTKPSYERPAPTSYSRPASSGYTAPSGYSRPASSGYTAPSGYSRPAAPAYDRYPPSSGDRRPASGGPSWQNLAYPKAMTSFGLFALAAVCVVLGVLFLTGKNLTEEGLQRLFKYGKDRGFGDLRTCGMIVGICWFVIAADAVYIWSQMSAGKENAPKQMTRLLVDMGALPGVYFWIRAALLVAQNGKIWFEYPYAEEDIGIGLLYLTIGLIAGFLNSGYFKRNSDAYKY